MGLLDPVHQALLAGNQIQTLIFGLLHGITSAMGPFKYSTTGLSRSATSGFFLKFWAFFFG